MDAVRFLEDLARMVTNGNKIETVTDFYITVETKHPAFGYKEYSFAACKDTVSGVERWSIEHPQKTRMQDFFEKYPKALKENDGTPRVCAENIGYCNSCKCDNGTGVCLECWSEPLE